MAAALEQMGGDGGDMVSVAPGLDGADVLSAYAVIEPLRWAVFVEQPRSEAFAPVYASMMRTGILLGVGLVLTLLVSVALARRMVNPIRALEAGAERLGEGQLDEPILIETGDELEELADQFNDMAAKLRESYAHLEHRVEERTHELSESLERQTATSEILRAISSSPTDYQPVFEVILANATRLCEAPFGALFMVHDGYLHLVSSLGGRQEVLDFVRANPISIDDAGSLGARAVRERIPRHRLDMADDPSLSCRRAFYRSGGRPRGHPDHPRDTSAQGRGGDRRHDSLPSRGLRI